MSALSVRPLDSLAVEINHCHGQVLQHARGMLLEAQRAGEALLEAKKLVDHGGFKQWVVRNCGPYSTFKPYMRVARIGKEVDLHLFDGGVRALLDAHAKRKPLCNSDHALTGPDAEHVLKIAALAERGVDGERDNAQRKLNELAMQHGMSAEEMVEKARSLQPIDENPFDQLAVLKAELIRRDRIVTELRTRFRHTPKDHLIAILADLKARGIWS